MKEQQLDLFPGGLCWGDPNRMREKYNAIKSGTDPDFRLIRDIDDSFNASVELMGNALTDEEREYL